MFFSCRKANGESCTTKTQHWILLRLHVQPELKSNKNAQPDLRRGMLV